MRESVLLLNERDTMPHSGMAINEFREISTFREVHPAVSQGRKPLKYLKTVYIWRIRIDGADLFEASRHLEGLLKG